MIVHKNRFLTLFIMAALALALVACGGEAEDPTVVVPTVAPTVDLPTEEPTPTEAMATPTEEAMSETNVFVETADVTVTDGRAQLTITGNLPDACAEIDNVVPTFSLDTNMFNVDIQTQRPEDELCAQVLTPFEHTMTLETADFAPGTYNVMVHGVTETFQLTAADQDMDDSTAAISPRSGPPGTTVQITATGLVANTEVELGVGQVASEYEIVDTAVTNANGTLNTTVQIPDYAETDDQWVVVVEEPNGAKTISNEFDVTTDAALFDSTQIYLIAVGDEGQSGKEIGCGDSAVPVTINIEPTIAPLTAALENMFAINEQNYGQSGLYNALYQSNLSVQGIDIDNGHATIALNGDLLVGGVCDTPRVEAQLRQTALQYSTIDSVSVTINGQPLDDLLSAAGS